MATAPFIIMSQLDTTGIKIGLKEIEALLFNFNPKASFDKVINVKELQAAKMQIKQLEAQIGTLNTKLAKAANNTGRLATNTKKTSNALADVSRRVFVWGTMSALIFGALQNMKEFYDLTIQVNTAIAELKKVLPTDTDFGALKGQSFQLSIDFGTDPMDVLQILKRFGQAGLSAAEAVAATKTALLALNTTGAETEQVFNAIIGANRIFGIAFEDSGRVIDKIMRLQADFAIDSKDLIASIQGIGPAITSLGGDIDDLFANIAALGEAARVSGKEAANSLKRVFARLVSKEGIAALDRLGVTVYATADSFRPLRDILADVSAAFEKSSQADQTKLAITLAQVRQYPKLLALLGNMERQQEALTKSQNAYGDATTANQVVMDTYGKQLTVTQNQLKQFGEAAVLKGGVVDTWATFNQIIGDTAESLTSVIGPITKVAGVLGTSLGIALAVKWITALKWSLKTTAVEMKATAAAASIATKNFQVLGIAVQTTASVFRIISGVLFAASAAYLLIDIALRKSNKETRRYNEIIEESTESIKKFKDSLRGVAVNNILTTDVEAKFNSLTQSLADYTKAIAEGDKTTREFVMSLGKTLGVDVSLFNEQQLKDLLDTLKNVQSEIDPNALSPFYDVINRGTESLISGFNTATDSYSDFRKKLEEKFGKLPVTEQISRFKEYEKALVGASALSTGFDDFEYDQSIGRFFSDFIDGAQGSEESAKGLLAIINKWRGSLELSAKSLEDIKYSVSSLQKTINSLADLGDQLSLLESKMKRNESITSQYVSTQKEYDRVLQEGSDIFGKAAGIQDIYQEALAGLVKSQQGAIVSTDAYSSKAKAFSSIISRLAGGFKDYAEQQLLASGNAAGFALDIKDGVKQVEAMLRAIQKGKGGVFSIEFNQHAYLKAVKDSTAVVLTNFEAQFKAIDVVRKVLANTGSSFDINNQALNTVDTALNQLNRQLGANEEEMANLKLQIDALIAAQKELNNEAERSGAKAQNDETISKLKIELVTLKKIQDQSINDYAEMTKRLLKLRALFEEYVNDSKKLAASYSSYSELFDAVIRKQIELNNLASGNKIKSTLAENEKLYRRILAVQLQSIQYEGELLGKSAGEISFLKDKARLQAENEIILQRVAAITEDFEKGYERVNGAVDSVRSSFSDLLGDTEQFFDILVNSASGFEIIKRGVIGISDAIARVDAEIIADKIAEVTRGAFPKPEDVSGELEKVLDTKGTTLALSIEDHLKKGGLFTGDKIQEAMKLGSEYFVERLTSGLTTAVQNAIAAIKERVIKEFTPTDSEVTHILKDASKIEAIPDNIQSSLEQGSKIGGDTLMNKIIEGSLAGSRFYADVFGSRNAISEKDFRALESQFTDFRFLAHPDLIPAVERSSASFNTQPVSTIYASTGKDRWETKLYDLMDSTQQQVITLSAKQLSSINEIPDNASSLSKKDNTFRDAAFRRLGVMVSQALAVSLANSLGKQPGDVQFGSAFGSAAGGIIGGPVGVTVGGIGGSFLGAIFGRDKEQENQEKQIKQLEAISRNTAQLVDLLSPEIINAPARFVLPVGTGAGGGVSITNNINASGGSISDSDLDRLSRQLEDVYVRTNRSNSSLR